MKRVPGPGCRVPVRGFALLAALAATACGSAGGLSPVAYPDPAAPCPAGRTGWKLEVLDRRATRERSEAVVSLIGDSIRRSFPGCKWDSDAGPEAGVLQIEVHRFATKLAENAWDAAAEWTVTASDAAGATLTQFDANEEATRPDYRGLNNEKESLREVFDRALRRTLAGLRVVSSAGTGRPPGRTGVSDSESGKDPGTSANSLNPRGFGYLTGCASRLRSVERFSHPFLPEVL